MVSGQAVVVDRHNNNVNVVVDTGALRAAVAAAGAAGRGRSKFELLVHVQFKYPTRGLRIMRRTLQVIQHAWDKKMMRCVVVPVLRACNRQTEQFASRPYVRFWLRWFGLA